MRTTVNLDDDVYKTVNQIAHASGRRFGQVLSDLARRGLQSDRASVSTPLDRRFPVFPVPENAPIVSAAHIQQLLDSEEFA